MVFLRKVYFILRLLKALGSFISFFFSRDMSRIDLVSKTLLANVFRNCRKRNTVIEKKLCQKITYKYQSFHIAKNILLTFEIFAIFAIFLLYFSDSSSL